MNSKHVGLAYAVVVMCVVVLLLANGPDNVDNNKTQEPLGWFWRSKKKASRALKKAKEEAKKAEEQPNSISKILQPIVDRKLDGGTKDFMNDVQHITDVFMSLTTTDAAEKMGAKRALEQTERIMESLKILDKRASSFLTKVRRMPTPDTQTKKDQTEVRKARRKLRDMEERVLDLAVMFKTANKFTPKILQPFFNPPPQPKMYTLVEANEQIKEVSKLVDRPPLPNNEPVFSKSIMKKTKPSVPFKSRKCNDCFCSLGPSSTSDEETLGAPLDTVTTLTTPFTECRCRSCD